MADDSPRHSLRAGSRGIADLVSRERSVRPPTRRAVRGGGSVAAPRVVAPTPGNRGSCGGYRWGLHQHLPGTRPPLAQATGRQLVDPSDSAVTLFPYYLLPSGLANLWGFQPIAPFTGKPWLSTSIVLGALLLVAVSVAAFWQLWKLNPSATVLVVMLLLAARLVQQRSDFGLFKLAMFAQPFLIGTLVVSWLALAERRWFRYAPLVLLAVAGLPAQAAYVERSESGAPAYLKSAMHRTGSTTSSRGSCSRSGP